MTLVEPASTLGRESEWEFEHEHVHQVYDEIASHFSSTRFKPWPVVDEFLKSLRPGTIGLDVGCGNGKYLTVREDVFIVASDRSHELLKFAGQHQPHSAVVADTLSLPHPSDRFDFAICIAVVHHLSTPERRREALRSILQTLRRQRPAAASPPSHECQPNTSANPFAGKDASSERERAGQALIFVWALEQKNSRRGWDAGMEQDVMVPWVLKGEHDRDQQKEPQRTTLVTGIDHDHNGNHPTSTLKSTLTSTSKSTPTTSTPPPAPTPTDTAHRPAHASARSQALATSTAAAHTTADIAAAAAAAAGSPASTSIDTQNQTRMAEEANEAAGGHKQPAKRVGRERADRMFHRYYHLYRAGELENDIVTAGGIVIKHGYDRDNWWAICEPGSV